MWTKDEPLWVFGYGSLIWNPEFDYSERCIGRLNGFRRSFCMWSIHHRGTVEDPGLVLALDEDKDAFCDGVAFCAQDPEPTLAALRERELISSAYLEEWHPVVLRDGQTVNAVCYVINRDHDQYCQLTLEDQAHVIAKAHGGRGSNIDYLVNTTSHIGALGLPDPDLDWLTRRVGELSCE